MIALLFMQEHKLLTADQLGDAKRSLQAMFLRASGEETMLRKLIEVLKTNKQLNLAFSDISKIQVGIGHSLLLLDDKISHIKSTFDDMEVTAEENKDFVGVFLNYADDVFNKVSVFHRNIEKYMALKEGESRMANMYRIAEEARSRLRQRLSGDLGSDAQSEFEEKIKSEVLETFDFGETEYNLRAARRESVSTEKEANAILDELSHVCQMSMNPAMRDKDDDREVSDEEQEQVDVFTLFSYALSKYPRLTNVRDEILELFKLFQYSYGMFRLDFAKLRNAVDTMINDPDAYFESKEEDEDIRAKRDKLNKIESLIPFLERTAQFVAKNETLIYAKFSKKISDTIMENKSPWKRIAEELLRMKVVAESELSTRI
jgi:hypothetical protein